MADISAGEAQGFARRHGGAVLEILEVTPAPDRRGEIADASIDAPRPGEAIDAYVLPVAGWVSGRDEPPVAVKLMHGEQGIRRAEARPVRASLPGRAARLGFATAVGVLGLPPEFDLSVDAVFRGGRPEPIATIRARHRPLRSVFHPALQPLMVTSMARTGTTWMMRILSQHPAVVVHRRHPYEMVPGRYWMHLLKVLAEPANHEQSTPVSHFEGDRFRIGHNPFFHQPYLDAPGLHEWFGRTHVEWLAALCQEMIDTYYRTVASAQGQQGAVFFAEKHLPDHIQWMLWELYSDPREVFLVRDPRDMVASMVAFNEQRGYLEFGRQNAASDGEWVDRIGRGVARLTRAWRARAGRAHLVRYEDLVTDPVGTLSTLLEFLGQPSPGSIEGLLARASRGAPELAGHQTSKRPELSIGRWRQTLDRSWWPHLDRAFGDLLGELGYD